MKLIMLLIFKHFETPIVVCFIIFFKTVNGPGLFFIISLRR